MVTWMGWMKTIHSRKMVSSVQFALPGVIHSGAVRILTMLLVVTVSKRGSQYAGE